MGFLDIIRSLFSGGARPGGKRLYIIDAAQLYGSGGNDRLSPRDQIQVLQQLARFADKENINVQAAFEGRALREVAHGGSFSGVTVFFADKTPALHDLVVSLFRKGSRGSRVVTVITGNRTLEQRVASAGGQTMRPSTLRRAMENGGGGGGGDRDRDRGPSQRRRRPPRRRSQRFQDRPQEQGQAPAPAQPQAAESPGAQPPSAPAEPAPPKGNDAVSDLIDLV